MTHIFDVEIAKEYGVNAAILLQNLGYWIMRNKANETNYYDGKYWTYNSRKAWSELFPYMSERQIDTAFKKLIDNGLVITGNYNKLKYDRTLWYALTQKGECILHFDGMEKVKAWNGEDQNVKPIPDVNSNDKPNVNSKKERKTSFDDAISTYTQNSELRTTIVDFIKMRKLIKAPMTDRALKGIFKELDKLGHSDEEKIAILEQSIERSWRGVFAISKPKQEEKQGTNSDDVWNLDDMPSIV
jgi:hypothetical protein